MKKVYRSPSRCFNTQPPEGGWIVARIKGNGEKHDVSTHSRLKAAGTKIVDELVKGIVSTHSRLKAAGDNKTAD